MRGALRAERAQQFEGQINLSRPGRRIWHPRVSGLAHPTSPRISETGLSPSRASPDPPTSFDAAAARTARTARALLQNRALDGGALAHPRASPAAVTQIAPRCVWPAGTRVALVALWLVSRGRRACGGARLAFRVRERERGGRVGASPASLAACPVRAVTHPRHGPLGASIPCSVRHRESLTTANRYWSCWTSVDGTQFSPSHLYSANGGDRTLSTGLVG